MRIKSKMDSICPDHSKCLVVWIDESSDPQQDGSYYQDCLSQCEEVLIGVITGINNVEDSSTDDVCYLKLVSVDTVDRRFIALDGLGRHYDYSVDCIAAYECIE